MKVTIYIEGFIPKDKIDVETNYRNGVLDTVTIWANPEAVRAQSKSKLMLRV